MSKRRWRARPRAPIARVAGVRVVLACVLLGCSGARPLASPGASDPDRSVESMKTQPIDVRPQAADLVGKTWLAEGPRGWEAGRIGGRSISLGRAEVGLAASGRWIVSAILQPTDAVALLFRDGPAAEPKRLDLGSLAPTTTAIAGDRAYVSGFSFAEQTDPGILEIDLEASTARAVLPPSKASGTR